MGLEYYKSVISRGLEFLKDGKLKKEKICICCSKCTELMRAGHTPGCVIRDGIYTEMYKNYIKKYRILSYRQYILIV